MRDGSCLCRRCPQVPSRLPIHCFIQGVKVSLPLAAFVLPLRKALQKSVRPPTARTRRRQRVVQLPLPMEGFAHLLRGFNTGEIEHLEWSDDSTRQALTPTRTTKGFREYQYWLRKPDHLNRFWQMQMWDRPIPGTPWRRGIGAQTLHLSQAAGRRGLNSLIVSSVTGNVSIRLREPLESAMPTVRIVFTVLTMDRNHVLWAQDFEDRTRAALRRMAVAGREQMILDPLYPTPPDAANCLAAHQQEDEFWVPLPAPATRQTAICPA